MKKGKEDELAIIEKILSYAEQSLNECKSLLSKHQETIVSLGIDIKVNLSQYRSLYGARIEPYNLKEKMKLPKFYKSRIYCSAYKNGKILTQKVDSLSVITIYETFFHLVSTEKMNAEFIQMPFSTFDTQMISLFKSVLAMEKI